MAREHNSRLGIYDPLATRSFSATVVIVTSPGCQTCNAYKTSDRPDGTSRRDRIVSALNGIDNIKVIEIEVPEMSLSVIKTTVNKYNAQLTNYVRWFPILLLFNDSYDDPNNTLEGVIYGAVNIGGKVTPSGGLAILEADKIKTWALNEINNNSIFNVSSAASSRYARSSDNLRSHGASSRSSGASSSGISSSGASSSSASSSSASHFPLGGSRLDALPIPPPGSIVRTKMNSSGCYVSCDDEEAYLREW
jgi:hypothetical protein